MADGVMQQMRKKDDTFLMQSVHSTHQPRLPQSEINAVETRIMDVFLTMFVLLYLFLFLLVLLL